MVAHWSRSTKLTYVGHQGWLCPGSVPNVRHLSWYVTSHPGQLSLAIPLWVSAMSTSQRAATSCGCGVKAGTVHAWVAGKTVWSPCYTRAISERFRDRGSIFICFLFILLYFFTDRQRQTDKRTTIPGPLNVADTQLIIMTQYNSHTESILDCPIKPWTIYSSQSQCRSA